ncbi:MULTISPECIES: hypothetical protein [Brevibacterium]|uniref:hypothetical protein n=1 Tax=Brevibacterium TaxID=1696 RepID=UPI001ABEEF09|nr:MULTISPECIES: hypothetical protein [Brevibacterium]
MATVPTGEISEQAVESAKISAAELGFGSQPGATAEFVAGGAPEFVETNLATDQRPDCVIIDPPQRGIGARPSMALEASGIEHIVYSTFAITSSRCP